MPITRKPKQDEKKIAALIEKGGSVAEAQVEKEHPIQLRPSSRLVSAIDRVRKSGLVKKTRHAWIMEAIHDKLQRELVDEL